MEEDKFRFWCSWVCKESDFIPVGLPSNGMVGWCMDGLDSQGNSIICCLIDSEDEDSVEEEIKNHWPGFDGKWRFIEYKDFDFIPNQDRFPLNSASLSE